jgi:hypothetical protein
MVVSMGVEVESSWNSSQSGVSRSPSTGPAAPSLDTSPETSSRRAPPRKLRSVWLPRARRQSCVPYPAERSTA